MPRADRWIVVLARDPRGAKSRLGAILGPEERSSLALAMLEDVLDATHEVLGTSAVSEMRLFVATESAEVRRVAARYGTEPLAVPARGTREAARDAAHAAAAAGAAAIALLPGDLPALSSTDVAALLDALDEVAHSSGEADVVIAPDRHRRGTNALVLRPPDALEPLFGPDSFVAHSEAAVRGDVRVHVVDRPGLALDIDEPADIRAATSDGTALGPRTARVLRTLLAASERG